MKTDEIIVNKSSDNPDGVKLEVIKPQTTLEQRLLAHLMGPYIRQLRDNDALPYKIPDSFNIEYLREGTFLLSGGGVSKRDGASGYYEPPKPIAIFGLRTRGRGFDLIHAEATRRAGDAAAKEGDSAGVEQSGATTTETDKAADEAPAEEAVAAEKSGD